VLIVLQLTQPADNEFQLSITKTILSYIKSESSLEQCLVMSSSTTFFKLEKQITIMIVFSIHNFKNMEELW